MEIYIIIIGTQAKYFISLEKFVSKPCVLQMGIKHKTSYIFVAVS